MAFSSVSLFVFGDDHPSLPIFPERQATCHTQVSQVTPVFQALTVPGRI